MGHPPGHGSVGFDDEGLYLDGEDTLPFDGDRHAGPGGGVVVAREEQLRWVGHFLDALFGHLEAAHLVGGSEPVFDGAQEPQ